MVIWESSAMGHKSNEAVLLNNRISLVEQLLQNSELQQNVSRGTIGFVLQITSDHPTNAAEYLNSNWRNCIDTLQSIQQHHQQQDDAIVCLPKRSIISRLFDEHRGDYKAVARFITDSTKRLRDRWGLRTSITYDVFFRADYNLSSANNILNERAVNSIRQRIGLQAIDSAKATKLLTICQNNRDFALSQYRLLIDKQIIGDVELVALMKPKDQRNIYLDQLKKGTNNVYTQSVYFDAGANSFVKDEMNLECVIELMAILGESGDNLGAVFRALASVPGGLFATAASST